MSSNEPMKNGCEVIYEMFQYKIMKHFIYHFTIIIILLSPDFMNELFESHLEFILQKFGIKEADKGESPGAGTPT